MKKNKSNIHNKLSVLPAVKKNIKAFFKEEEGAISKKDAITLGLSLVALGTILAETAAAHDSYFYNKSDRGAHHSHDSSCSSGGGSSCSCGSCLSCGVSCACAACGI